MVKGAHRHALPHRLPSLDAVPYDYESLYFVGASGTLRLAILSASRARPSSAIVAEHRRRAVVGGVNTNSAEMLLSSGPCALSWSVGLFKGIAFVLALRRCLTLVRSLD